ncbi:MAG: PhzF family phenazine biosynthesis protein [Bacteroidota bacterium]
MKQRMYQVDAFAETVFTGNPAAVCPLDTWLSDEIMQKIAMENNLAETAFFVKKDEIYELRWFTPKVEVDLCGHATLAAAYVLFNHENFNEKVVRFYSPRSGELTVTKNGDLLTLNFPADVYQQIGLSDEIRDAFNKMPLSAYKGKTDYLLVFDKEDDIKTLVPGFDAIARLGGRGLIATAKGDTVDFVSRFFAPQSGVYEDPVTGSAHTTLVPYWHSRLCKSEMTAIQLSQRKGYLQCKYLNDRVEISGQGKLYLVGEIFVD